MGGRGERVTRRRPWTRAATLATSAHIAYELLAGVAMPFASRLGPRGASAWWAACAAAAYRQAARTPAARDPLFAVLNGMYLSAMIGHFTGWPRTRRPASGKVGVPWLTECEGLTGPVMGPYNAILYVSGLTAIGGLVENRRGAAVGALVPLAVVPWMPAFQRREFSRLVDQAQHDRGWWNRRLQQRYPAH